MNEKVCITLTKHFMEFDDGNEKLFCSDITVINVVGSDIDWFVRIYSIAHDHFSYKFDDKKKAEAFAKKVCDAYADWILLRDGNTQNIKMVWE